MKTIVSVIIALLLIGLGWVVFNGIHLSSGNGQQVGYVSATEVEGVLFKTNRAYIKPTLESTQEDIYCVVDPEVYRVLTEYSESKTAVRVSHISWFTNGKFFCKYGENAVITAVQPI